MMSAEKQDKAIVAFRHVVEDAQKLLTTFTLYTSNSKRVGVSPEELQRCVDAFRKSAEEFASGCEIDTPGEV